MKQTKVRIRQIEGETRGRRKNMLKPESDSDSDSDFVAQRKKKSTNVDVLETSKHSSRRKTKKDEHELPKPQHLLYHIIIIIVVFKVLMERKKHTHWSSCTNMNVFADLLTVLGQERFQQFLEQTPFGIFYEMHHIKIQCQLLRNMMILEK
ncbi:hypothetical protein H5410_054216 [Solanum commersonii]|uniref:Uncharacterized protein n=1 Tax=Solanum commersonii TaxID=4109 RepID=A0A9J5X7Y2_SOLCO|nr:hypothetical protein H5410_054216 [Solanum commersonii]